MKKSLLILICIGIAGCAFGPQTKQELYSNYGYLEKRCLDKSHKEAVDFLYQRMNHCIAGVQGGVSMVGVTPVSWSSSTTIQKDSKQNESTVSAYKAGGPGHYMYTTVVKIKTTDACPSELTVYGTSSYNKIDLTLIDRWLAGHNDCKQE